MNRSMKSGKVRSHRGFTLLEAFLVVVVLIVLLSVAIPSFKRMQATARSAGCAAKLRQIGLALNLYANDNSTRMPVMVAGRDSLDQDDPALDTVLLEYVTGEDCFQCPGDHKRIWAKTGTSYFWNSTLNRQMIGNLDFLGLTKKEVGIPMVSDKENFHESIGDEVNILYADGHVQKELQFVVDN